MHIVDDQTTSITTVINQFAKVWTLLLQYDEDSLSRPKTLHPTHKSLDYQKALAAITILKAELTKRGEVGNLFGLERDHQLQGILGNIGQTFDGKANWFFFYFCCFLRRIGSLKNPRSSTTGLLLWLC